MIVGQYGIHKHSFTIHKTKIRAGTCNKKRSYNIHQNTHIYNNFSVRVHGETLIILYL